MKRALIAVICLLLGGVSMTGTTSWAADCDMVPTGIETHDYWLHFTVPAGLMPDRQFDGRPAKLRVHRVQPVYANTECPAVTRRAAVLVHGRTLTGPVAFDTRYPAPGGGTLSVQEALARAGIDTFAPSLLGYGDSTTLGLDDPANASLNPFDVNGDCPHPEGCDHTHNPQFELDQQGRLLLHNPLDGQRKGHSSRVRFAGTDVWVRDIAQVIDDAIARAHPTDGKVTLLGFSLGAMRVGRALDGTKHPGIVAKVNRAVFVSPFFFVAPNIQAPTEETAPPAGFATFPLNLVDKARVLSADILSPAREAVCPGYDVAGRRDHQWAQLMADDLGGKWSGPDKNIPAGVLRAPTFSSYGWNAAVAGRLTPPTLVMQGLDDAGVPAGAANAPAIYDALPASLPNKVLVQVDCATHAMVFEGCSNAARCQPVSGTPYGGQAGRPWTGAHSTVKAALIEWITDATFNGATTGRFLVNSSGVANPAP